METRFKWEIVVESLISEIREGRVLRPGDDFWTMRELKSSYRISHTTANRVFKELYSRGYISRPEIMNRRYTVAPERMWL